MKFSDLGAARLRRAVLVAAAEGGALRAREEEVVEKRRGVVVAMVVGMARVRRERRLKSPVMEVDEAILKMAIICSSCV